MKTPALIAALCLTCHAHAEPLRVLSWNVESEGADPAIVGAQLAELGRYDAYCLQEVAPSDVGRYAYAIRDAHGKAYRYIISSLGGTDRLVIAFDAERLDLIESRELFRHGEYVLNNFRYRGPLVLAFRDATTGKRFYLMTVHLARGNAAERKEQAIGLREWAKSLRAPVIGIGDFNFDFDIPTERGNESFAEFTAEGSPWRWAKPDKLVDTNWDDRDGDGRDNYPDSMLDFAFTAGDNVTATSEVIVREGDFPDTHATSDHRPLKLTVEWATR